MKTLFEGKKLYALIIVFFFIITFFIVFNIIHNHYKYVVKNTIAENTLKARFFSLLIFEHQKATIGILESYAQRSSFINVVKKKDFNNAISHLKSLSKHYNEIDILFLTDQYGTVWANYPVDKTGFGKNLAYRDWYKGVSKKWRPYISTVFRLIVLEKDLAVAVSVPVFDRNGKVIGILGSTQRAPFLATFINGNITNPEKSITLLDQKGDIIFSNSILYQENITKYPDARVLEKAVAGVFINMDIADAKDKGSISYVSITPVKGIGWSVIVGQEKDTILKSLYGYFIRSAVTGFTIFLFLAVSLLYFRREYKYRKTKELLQAEEKYRNIFNDAILGIYQTTPEGRFLSANPALARLCGYDTPEELTNCVTDLATQIYVNPEDRETFKGILSRKGVVEKFETQLHKKNGGIIWVSINTHIVKDTKGNITHYEGTIEDITERKLAEEALLLAEENFRRSLEDSSLGVRIATIEGETIYANRAMLNIYGYDSIGELRTIPLKERYTPESYAEFQIRKEKRHQGKYDPSEYEVSIVRKNGEVRHLQVFRRGILWNGERQFQIIYQDITERKLAEEALRESKKRWEELFNRSSNAIAMYNAIDDGQDFIFKDLNPAGERIDHVKREDIIGHRVTDIFPGIKAFGLFDVFLRVWRTENPERYGVGFYKDERIEGWRENFVYKLNTGEIVVVYEDVTEQKKAEEALLLIRNAVESASDAIGMSDPQGHHFYQNKSFTNLFEYTAKELEAAGGGQVVFSSSDTGREVFDAIMNGRSWSGETEMTSKSGRRFPVLLRADALKNDVGKIISVLGTFTDITERKRIEETLRESEERFRLLAEQSLMAIGIIQDGVFKYFNRKYEEISGYSADEIEGWKPFEFSNTFHPDDMNFVMNQIKKKQAGHPDIMPHYYFRIIHKNGGIRWIEVYSKTMTYKNKLADMVTLIDITERKKVENALRESEERYRTLTEKTIAGIYLIQDGLFRYVNPTFCNIHGYTRDELVDKLSPLDLVVEEEKELLNNKIEERLLGEKGSGQFSIRIRRKDGEIRFLEVFSSYALYAGKPGVLGTCVDMTEARRANEAIKRSQKELRSLTAYLQNVREEERIHIAREIHDELGQSLTGIKIDISWLKKKLSNIVEPADPIQTKIDSLLTLTESTIATTRELSFSLRPGILDDLGLATAINWQLKRFQEKVGIICMLQSDVAEITIPADYATALFRISQECLTNISRHANATKVKITLTREGENLILEIEDNGKGITTEQIRNPLSLGLLGMRERIKNLKGKFHISGAPGKGTKVRVELPIK